jgi:hypothetical protein
VLAGHAADKRFAALRQGNAKPDSQPLHGGIRGLNASRDLHNGANASEPSKQPPLAGLLLAQFSAGTINVRDKVTLHVGIKPLRAFQRHPKRVER